MVLLIIPTQQLIREIWSGIWGNGYNFSVFGLSDITIVIISIMLILISLYLFTITEPFFHEEKKETFE